jgi:hypothetical protein
MQLTLPLLPLTRQQPLQLTLPLLPLTLQPLQLTLQPKDQHHPVYPNQPLYQAPP